MDRKSKIELIKNTKFDLVIIGGGITGAGIVRDASMRGLKCLLLDKNDFAGKTSSNSGKLIHGGLRYLRYFNFKTVFESCQERINLHKKVAPHLIMPIKFLIPFYKTSKTPRWLSIVGLFLYDLLSLFRNVHSFNVVSKEDKEINELGPYFQKNDFTGAVTFYDCFVNDARLTIESIVSAEAFGAINLNYIKVEKVDYLGKMNWSLTVADQLTNDTAFEMKSSTVISAAGAWSDELLGKTSSVGQRFNMQITSGAHLIIPKERLKLNHTMAVESPINYRSIYFIPWGDSILVGTTDFYYNEDKEKLQLTQKHVDYLLNVINHYFPSARITEKDIKSSFIGIRPLIGSDISSEVKVAEEKISRDYKIISDENGFFAISGGKLTTYRLMAQKCVDQLCKNFFPQKKRVDTLQTLPVLKNDIQSITENEYVEKLSDLLIRRIPFYYLGSNQDIKQITEYAQTLGKIKNWNQEKIELEIKDYFSEIDLKLGVLKPTKQIV